MGRELMNRRSDGLAGRVFGMALLALSGLSGLAAQEGGLSESEKRWLAQHPNLRLAPDPNFPPFEFFDDKAVYQGIAADYMRLIEARLGIEFDVKRLRDWDEVLSLAEARSVDLLAAVMSSPKRERYMRFTRPHIELPGVIFVESKTAGELSMPDLKGMRVAVVSGYVWQDLLELDWPGIELDLVPDVETGLQRVSFGEVDAMIGDPATATYYLEKQHISNIKIAGDSGYRYRLAFAVRKDWPELHGILEKTLAGITEEERKGILQNWIHENDKESLSRLWRGLLIVLGVCLALISAVLIWNRALRSRVSSRTRELEAQIKIREEVDIARAAAIAANEAKSEFLANVSHEIRNPMAAILGFSELLLDPSEGDERKQDAALTIRSNGEHLLALLNNVLDLSKLESGRVDVECIETPLLPLLVGLGNLISLPAAAKGLELEFEAHSALPAVIRSDPTKLRQILVNLLGNAIKFTSSGKIQLLCRFLRGQTNRLSFDVVDQGIGMTEEQQKKVFEAFAQADASTTRRFGGSGLGLAISRRLARLLGGDIFVEGRLDEGCCFSVSVQVELPEELDWLPPGRIDLSQAGDTEREDGARSGKQLDGLSILYAEDGPDNQRLVSHILGRAGGEVTLVDNGELAVRAIAAASFDVILMDMQMPVMDGYSAARDIRASGCETPIIALTAQAMSSDRARCIAAGCDEYLSKPIKNRLLVEAVGKIARACQRAGRS